MTTTNVFQGLGDGSRSSSKVLKPPGGGSSNIFGDPDPPRRPTAQQQQQQTTNVLGQPMNASSSTSFSQDQQDDSKPSDLNTYESEASHLSTVTGSSASDLRQNRTHAKAPQVDTHGNLFGGSSSTGQQASRRKGDVSSENMMEQQSMAFSSRGAMKDSTKLAAEADLKELRKATLAMNLNHAKAPLYNTHSNIFGNEPLEQTPTKRRLQHGSAASYNIITGEEESSPSELDGSPLSKNGPAPASNPRHRGAYNPITGEDYGSAAPPSQQRTSGRVMNPPGGKSSGLW